MTKLEDETDTEDVVKSRDPRAVAVLAFSLVTQVLDEAYIIANEAQQSGQPWDYITMLKNLKSGKLCGIDNENDIMVIQGSVGDNINIYQDEIDSQQSVATSTPQKAIGSKQNAQPRTETNYIGQGDEDSEKSELNNSTAIYINQLFDMSEVEKNIDYGDLEQVPSNINSNVLIGQAMNGITESQMQTNPFVNQNEEQNISGKDRLFEKVSDTTYSVVTKIFDTENVLDLYFGNNATASNADEVNEECDKLQELEMFVDLLVSDGNPNNNTNNILTHNITEANESKKQKEIFEDNVNELFYNSQDDSFLRDMSMDVALSDDYVRLQIKEQQEMNVLEDDGIIILEYVDGNENCHFNRNTNSGEGVTRKESSHYETEDEAKVICHNNAEPEVNSKPKSLTPRDDNSDTKQKIDTTDRDLDFRFYENTYLTLNRDDEQSSNDESYPVLKDPKVLSMHDVKLSEQSSQDDSSDNIDPLPENTKLAATSTIVGSGMSRKSSLSRRMRMQGSRILNCLRGWWKKKSPGRRKEHHAPASLRGLCALSPDARRRVSALLDQSRYMSPSPSRSMVWKFNTVSEALMTSSKWKEYVFEENQNDNA